MIRFAGFAHCSYDFSESVAEHRGPCAFPDGTPSNDASVPSESSLLFEVLVDYGAKPLRSLTAFVLVPNDLEERAIFERLRTCLADERNDCEGRTYCTKCGAEITTRETSCSRCGAQQFSVESLAAELESLHLRTELKMKTLFALQESVMMTASFRGAIERLLARPVHLMPAKASTFQYVLLRDRVWTAREFLSPEEWDALVRNYHDRTNARLQSVVRRCKGNTEPSECDGITRSAIASVPSYQTAPLTHYRAPFRKQADIVFEELHALVGQRAKRYKGSYSILAKTGAKTVAKIIIYQRGLGRENGVWPAIEDGVYILVRAKGEVEPLIWEAETIRSTISAQVLDTDATIGIAPKREQRFAYFRVAEPGAHSAVKCCP